MRLLVIGNSQTAALRTALHPVLPEGEIGPATYEGVDIEFFCQMGGRGPALFASGGRLACERATPGSFTTIVGGKVVDGVSLDAFDAVVMAGVGLPADRGNPRHILTTLECAEFAQKPSDTAVSRQFFGRAIELEHRTGPQWGTIQAVRQLYSGPLLLLALPLPGRAVLNREEFTAARRYGPRTREFLSWYYRASLRILRAGAAHLTPVADVIPVPVPAWYEDGFTPDAYVDRDPWHMNGAYGELVLRQILDWTATAARSRPALTPATPPTVPSRPRPS